MLTAAAVAAPIIMGAMGQSAAAGDRAAQMATYQQALAQYNDINIPDIEKQKLALQTLQQQGLLTPELEQAVQQGQTAMADVQTDPRLKQAQMSALDTLSKMGAEGLTSTDRAALNAARRQVAGDEQARQAQILQSMQQRGIGGSGVELATRLASSQGAADRAAQGSDNLMAQAQQRMLAAVQAQGSLGSQIRNQDFGEQSAIASAKDQIANFNAQQQAASQARNIAAKNNAQATNLSEKQRVADANVATQNAQQQYNKQLQQTQFQNQLNLAGARGNAMNGVAQQYGNQATQTANNYANIGRGVGSIIGGFASKKQAGEDEE